MRSLRSSLAAVVLLAVAGAMAVPARAVGVPAGTVINNTAEVSYVLGGSPVTTTSNTVSLTVAEVLNVVVTAQTPVVNVSPGATDRVLVFRVTNIGNGTETFRLAMTSVLGGDDFDPVPAVPAIYFDTDASGTLTAGDVAYTEGANDPALAADAGVTVLLVNAIPGTVSNGQRGLSRLSAEARTGVGAPGTSFPGQGAGGTDAVVGTTGAAAQVAAEYLVGDLSLSAVKSATLLDPFGGARVVPGARINYQIVITPQGSGSATGVAFADPIPAGTTYVAGSLRLNGGALSDASDADAGAFVSSPAPRVTVALGSLSAASGPQTIQFAVTIN